MSAHAVGVLAALADAERLRVYAWLVARDAAAPSAGSDAARSTLAAIAAELDLELPRLQKIVGSLVAAGLVAQSREGLHAVPEAVTSAASAVLDGMPLGHVVEQHPRLRSVVRNGIAERLPASAELKSELAGVLAAALPEFDDVDEPHLNAHLATLTTDVPLMRRLLVDEGFLVRDAAGSTYRRA